MISDRAVKSALILTLALLALIVACGDDDNPTAPTATVPDSVVGTWNVSQVVVDGDGVSPADFFEWTSGAVAATLEIAADGTALYRENDADGNTIFYDDEVLAIDGNTLTVTCTGENGHSYATPELNFDGTWAAQGGNLVLTQSAAGTTVVITIVPEDPPSIPAALVGTWMPVSITVDDAAQDLAAFFDWDPTTVRATFTVNARGLGLFREWAADDSTPFYDHETLNVHGDGLAIVMVAQNGATTDPEITFDGTWTVTGDDLVLTTHEEGSTIVLTWTK